MATLPNGAQVSVYGKVFTPRGVEVIPLHWTSRVETRTTSLQCKKLEGRYKRVSSGAEGSWSTVFVNETYTVEVTYEVIIMTSNEGEEAVFSPDMPDPDMLSVWTGYGRDTSFTMNNVPPTVPPMPSERVIKHHVSLEEKLQWYYDSAIQYFEENPLA